MTTNTQFISCQNIGRRRIEIHNETRTLLIDQAQIVKFTPTEYKLIVLLLNQQRVADRELISTALQYDNEDSRAKDNLDKHIDNIRSKLRPIGIDIFRVLRWSGYLIGEHERKCI